MLGLYGVMCLHGTLGARMEMERFAALHPHVVAEAEEGNVLSWLAFDLDFGLWSKGRIRAYEKVAGQSPPPEAILSIPRIDLRVPVLEGTDELTLNRGVGRIEGTARIGEPGNVGIAGHRDGFFRGLKELTEGDVLDLTTAEGNTSYLVDRILIVNPEDVEVLETRSAHSLTLVTCYPFYICRKCPAALYRSSIPHQRWLNLAPGVSSRLPFRTTGIGLKANIQVPREAGLILTEDV